MNTAAHHFGQHLTEVISHIRGREDKLIGFIQDEIGIAIGPTSGSAIEY